MALEYSSDVYYYQILNEFNWNQELMGEFEPYVSSCYQGLLDGEGTTDLNHKSAFKTIVNVWTHTTDWDPDLRQWLDNEGDKIDIIAIDHYPVSYDPFVPCDYWAPLDSLFDIMRDYSKEGAIMETGFPTHWWPIFTEATQAGYVNCVLPIIRDKVRQHASTDPTLPLLLANWYELVDHCTGCWIPNPLDRFGLLHTGANIKKLAYDDFQSQVAMYEF